MRQTEKMMMNIAFMILAYAYAVTNYLYASLVCAGISIVLSVSSHSVRAIWHKKGRLWLLIFITGFLAELIGFGETMPIMPTLCVTNAFFTIAWSCSSFKAIDEPMRHYYCITAVVLLASVLMPASLIPFLAETIPASRIALLSFVLLMFGPATICFAPRYYRAIKRTSLPIIKLNNDANFVKIKQ